MCAVATDIPLFQRHDELTLSNLEASITAGLSREMGQALPRDILLRSLQDRVRGFLTERGGVGEWKERLTALVWYASLPVYSLETLPWSVTGEPFWVFSAELADAENRAKEDMDSGFYVQSPSVGFNFFLREIEYKSVSYLTLRLEREAPFSRVSLMNLTPVLGVSTQDGYNSFRSAVTRSAIEGHIPPGLKLATP